MPGRIALPLRPRALAIAAAVMGLTTVTRATTWTAASGDWSLAGNWSDGAPTSEVDAVFDRTDAYVVTLTSASAARDLMVLNSQLTLSTAGQTLSARDLTLGASAVMYISGGGTVQHRNARIGTDGTVATVAVMGAGSSFSASGLAIGSGADGTTLIANRGTLALSGGGTVYNSQAAVGENGGVGELTIDGVGTSFNGEQVHIGSSGGGGSLALHNGGSFAAINCNIGYSGRGKAVVDTGASLDTSGTPFGSLSVGYGSQSTDSALSINGGRVKAVLMQIGSGTGGTGGVGSVNISGVGASLTVSTLAVGRSSNLNADNASTVGTATLDIGVGGVVTVANTLVLGTGDGASLTTGGVVNLNGGTLAVASLQRTGTASPISGGRVNFFGGTLRATGTLAVDCPLILSAPSVIDTDGNRGAVSGMISDGPAGGGTFIKSGLGTLALTGANTYTGGTSINGGTLRAVSDRVVSGGNVTSSSTGTGTVTVNSGATLAGTGGTGDVAVAPGGTITAGTGATSADSVGTLTTGSQGWNAGGRAAIKFASASSFDVQAIDGLLNLSALDSGHKFTLSVINTAAGALVSGIYKIVNTTGGISANGSVMTSGGTDLTDLFVLNVDGINVAGPGAFSVTAGQTGGGAGDLYLNYTTNSAPEPTTTMLVAIAGLPLLGRRRGALATFRRI